MINFNDLTFQYPQSNKPLFNRVNLHIPANSLTLVSGSSGSGKSTLLRCINGLVPHFSGGTIAGKISVFGVDPIQEGPEKMAEYVGFVFQEPESQFIYDTVEDEIAFVLENFGIPYQEMHRQVNEMIKVLKLGHLREEKIQNLSGGEKQKVALASVMITHPKVLLLDEPTSQLDPTAAEELLDFVLELKFKHGLTVLISEHRLERLLPKINNILHIDDSHNIHYGVTQEILKQMTQVPPIIEIGREMDLAPLPLSVKEFPPTTNIGQTSSVMKHKEDGFDKPTLIEVVDFSVKLSGRDILKSVVVDIKAGEILTILGPTGAGKTTLLRAIMGLIESEGIKRLEKTDMHGILLPKLIETIAYLPQNPNDLLFSESVIEELKTTLKNHGMQKSTTKLTDFLKKFGLAAVKDRYPRDLSVGERQRTALAAITVHDPKIIFLDEPTRGMDYRAKDSLATLLRSWRDQQKAIVLVTHDVEFAAALSDRAIILEEGRIRFEGAPRIAFTRFPKYQTQTAKIFPGSSWISQNDALINLIHS